MSDEIDLLKRMRDYDTPGCDCQTCLDWREAIAIIAADRARRAEPVAAAIVSEDSSTQYGKTVRIAYLDACLNLPIGDHDLYASPPPAPSGEPLCYVLTCNGALCEGESVVSKVANDLQVDSHQDYAADGDHYEATPVYRAPPTDPDLVEQIARFIESNQHLAKDVVAAYAQASEVRRLFGNGQSNVV